MAGLGSVGVPALLRAKEATAAADRKDTSVILIWLDGGPSHLETFDPKPVLNQYAGKSIGDTPYKDALTNPALKDNLRVVVPNDANGHIWPKVYPLQVGYRKRGEAGIEVSDWWPHLSNQIDDLAIVRSIWCTDNNHGAQLQFHTGRHSLDGFFPTIGSWVHYGLGSLNDNLPQFVVMGTPIADCCGGKRGHGGNYLGPEHSGVELKVDPKNPLPFSSPPAGVYREEQRAEVQRGRGAVGEEVVVLDGGSDGGTDGGLELAKSCGSTSYGGKD